MVWVAETARTLVDWRLFLMLKVEELTLKNAIRKEEEAKDEIFSGDESHIVRLSILHFVDIKD